MRIFVNAKDFSVVTDAPVIAIDVGTTGFYPIYSRLNAATLNNNDRITDDVIQSAVAGSMFGWNCPAAKLAMDFAGEVTA